MASGEHRARRLVAERSGGVCERCARARAGEFHHRLNRSQGGAWCAANGLHLCHDCHRWATEYRTAAAETGHIVRAWHSPATVPVVLPLWGWVYLEPEGGLVLAAEADQHQPSG